MSIWIIALPIAVFISLIVWWFLSVITEVPAENRQYLDRPALGFRLAWPLIRTIEHHFKFMYSADSIENTHLKLKQAGAEYSLSAEQFLSARWVCALLFSSFVVALLFPVLGRSILIVGFLVAVGGFFYPELWLKEKAERRRKQLVKALPFYLDVITLSVEAGSNLAGGIGQAVKKTGDSELRREFSRLLRDIRAGKSRADALRELADRSGSPKVKSTIFGILQAERTGSALGPILRAQSDQLRLERFQRAEKLAMEAPVKMLLPLVAFIFPTTFLVLGFLIISKMLMQDLISNELIEWAWRWPGRVE